MRFVLLMGLSGLVGLAGCTPPEASTVPDRLALADGPAFVGSIDAVLGDLQRRATWVPDAPGLDGGAWVHGAAGLRGVYGDRVVLMDLEQDAWQVDFELTHFGRMGSARELTGRRVSAYGPRVTIDRGGVHEWFDNRGDALEHGIDLLEEPGGAGPVVVEISVRGDLAPRGRGSVVELVGVDDRATRVRIDHLVVSDVDGDVVPAHLESECTALDCVLRYVIDDSEADWPLVVDPVLHSDEVDQSGLFSAPGYGGYRVDVSVDRVIASFPGDPTNLLQFGGALILARNETGPDTWDLEFQDLTSGLNSFGHAVAIDGEFAVVGAPESGVARVYQRLPTGWAFVEDLARVGEQFGASVDVSGDRIVVGAPNYSVDATASGQVFEYVRGPVDWVSQETAIPPFAPLVGQQFGSRVAFDGRVVVAGSSDTGGVQGRVDVLERDDTGAYSASYNLEILGDGAGARPAEGVDVAWPLAVFSDPTDPLSGVGDRVHVLDLRTLPGGVIESIAAPPNAVEFGARVATDGRTIAVASLEDPTATGVEARVWLYEETGADWGLVADFPVASAGGIVPDVAIADGVLVIGKPDMGTLGEVSIYRQSGTWVQSTFSPTDGVNGTQPSSRTGAAVAVAGNRIAIGMPEDGIVASSAGRVVLIERDPSVAPDWPATGTLLADPFAGADQRFGASLDMHGEWIAVGAPGVGALVPSDGAAHLFRDTTPVFSFTGSVSRAGDSVAVGEDVFAIGMPIANSVEVVKPSGGVWASVNTLGDSGDFGASLDIDGHWLVVGRPTEDLVFTGGGAVSIYDLHDSSVNPVVQEFGSTTDARFGTAVALVGESLLVGAPGPALSASPGEVRYYEFDGDSATLDHSLLLPLNASSGDRWGFSLAASGDRLIVGSRADRAAIYERNSGGANAWGSAFEPVPMNLTAGEDFGFSVAIDGRTAIVGSPERGPSAGRVTVLELDQQFEPTLIDDFIQVEEDTLIVFDVTANDYDANGDPFTVTEVGSLPPGITSALSGSGEFTYLPPSEYEGLESFTYQADGFPYRTAVVNIEVVAVNDVPILDPDHPTPYLEYDVDEDANPFVSPDSVVDYLFDPDAVAPPTVAFVPDLGTIVPTLNSDGTFDYTPLQDDCGHTESFWFEPTDDDGATGPPIEVRLNLICINDAPTVSLGTFYATEGQTLVVGVPGLLEGASDVEGDGIVLDTNLVAQATEGTVIVGANGSFTWNPTPGSQATSDSFTFSLCDDVPPPGQACRDVPVGITIYAAASQPPIVVDDAYTIFEDAGMVRVDYPTLLSNDYHPDGPDALTASLVNYNPINGVVVVDSTGSFEYTPAQDFAGTNVFEYSASAGGGPSDSGYVTITVLALNDPPQAFDDTYDNIARSGLTVDALSGVLVNDSDPDANDVITAIVKQSPANGFLDLSPDGSFEYVPDPDHIGTDEFRYVVSDGLLMSSEATVTLITDGATTGTTTTTDTATPCPTWFTDNDGDGFGDDRTAIQTCDPPELAVSEGGDCDDTDPTRNPDADEIPGDDIDQDCDEDASESVTAGGDCDCDSGGAPHPVLALLGLLLIRRRSRC